MKTQFKSLTALASEVERIDDQKKDFLAQNGKIEMIADTHLYLETVGQFNINDYAHGQFSEKLGIPKTYYDKMLEVQGLRSHNVNAWFKKSPMEQHFVRTLDGMVRAYLSNKFRPFDNAFVMSAFLPVIAELKETKEITAVEMRAGALTDRRMYLQITFPDFTAEPKVGDPVRWGICATNSEVGAGAVDIKKMMWFLTCVNGQVGQSIIRQYHIGKRINDEHLDIFQDDTIRAGMESMRLRMRDSIKAILNRDVFDEECAKLRRATGDEVKKPLKTIENVTKRYTELPKSYIEPIVENMASNNNMTRYGVAAGISFMAHEIEDSDKGFELERVAQNIIDLSPTQWEEVAA